MVLRVKSPVSGIERQISIKQSFDIASKTSSIVRKGKKGLMYSMIGLYLYLFINFLPF
jgi:hypothetical protein